MPSILGWKRIRLPLFLSAGIGFLIGLHWTSGVLSAMTRTMMSALFSVLVFGLFERWPRHLPARLPRWIVQVVAVGVTIPFLTAIVWWLSTPEGAPAFYTDKDRMEGFSMVSALGLLISPWVALGALVRQKEAFAREQALKFDLERSELERQALDARLNLLSAQVQPHFLFNTLANVQALVDTGSPQASEVLKSLVAYLRAAVPRLNEPASTLDRELELVRAYLDLMHMRMPDRLRYALEVDPDARFVRCPPMTLLTLVENAVRHGIDPSEEGGTITIQVRRVANRCHVRVTDTGAGFAQPSGGLGTGLSRLRERLTLAFHGDARLQVEEIAPHGVRAELEFPAEET